ncbi:hypothetical protein WJX73_006361 [Symbiochloris irregularis]|uniref:Nuclear GTPase SLIP-GC n=1 Tax=Symbiochloris irregularis TaxID=706552 RepID=A0AAW1PZY6_9CHLO
MLLRLLAVRGGSQPVKLVHSEPITVQAAPAADGTPADESAFFEADMETGAALVTWMGAEGCARIFRKGAKSPELLEDAAVSISLHASSKPKAGGEDWPGESEAHQKHAPASVLKGTEATPMPSKGAQDQEASTALLGSSDVSAPKLASKENVRHWTSELEAIRQRLAKPRTIIGVFGSTGAGKSSMLNCLLGEEDVLPTSGMRACTACVVELSWHQHRLYEADVEFMTKKEWHNQIKSLWHDLLDEEGNLDVRAPDRVDTRSAAGAAQAVIQSVLGHHIVKQKNLTLQKVLEMENKQTKLLGRTIHVKNLHADKFRKEVGQYVDSNNALNETSSWPLVKLCRIRHNWAVLETGAVLLDLPGTQDSNAARGAVAEAYLKSCNAIWIVSVITRAVNDRAAKDLLSKGFRTQMLMDGQFGSISFVATKTDDINSQETLNTLSVGATDGIQGVCEYAQIPREDFEKAQLAVMSLQEKHEEQLAKQKLVAAPVKKLKRRLTTIKKQITKLSQKKGKGKGKGRGKKEDADYSPKAGGGSRKRSVLASASKSARRRTSDAGFVDSEEEDESEADEEAESADEDSDEEISEDDSDIDSFIDDAESDAESDAASDSDVELSMISDGEASGDENKEVQMADAISPGAADAASPAKLSKEAKIAAKSKELKDEEALKRPELRAKDKLLKVEKDELERLSSKVNKAQGVVASYCARARNAYARQSLKADFKDGMEEMVRQAGGGSSSKEVQTDLPVFCVSSRDAHKLEKRFKKEKGNIFTALEHTEILQLRQHVHSLTEVGRQHAAKVLSSRLSQFLALTVTSLMDEGTLDANARLSAKRMFEEQRRMLKLELMDKLIAWEAELRETISVKGLAPRLGHGASRAKHAAMDTVAKWGSHTRDGGYYWATYKAVCRRHGHYTGGSRGEVAFNGDLARPILDLISTTWDHLFNTTAMQFIQDLITGWLASIENFLQKVVGGMADCSVDPERAQRISIQVIQVQKTALAGIKAEAKEEILQGQRELSRSVLAPTIQKQMMKAYDACTEERGKGSFMRMKDHMTRHTDSMRNIMFAEATRKLREEIEGLIIQVKEHCAEEIGKLLRSLPQPFSLLWDAPLCDPKDRHRAARKLRVLCERMVEVCAKAGSTAAAVPPAPPAAHEPAAPEPDFDHDQNDDEEEEEEYDEDDEEEGYDDEGSGELGPEGSGLPGQTVHVKQEERDYVNPAGVQQTGGPDAAGASAGGVPADLRAQLTAPMQPSPDGVTASEPPPALSCPHTSRQASLPLESPDKENDPSIFAGPAAPLLPTQKQVSQVPGLGQDQVMGDAQDLLATIPQDICSWSASLAAVHIVQEVQECARN